MTETPIPIPKKTQDFLREVARTANAAIRDHEVAVASIKVAYDVPDSWDPLESGEAFVPPGYQGTIGEPSIPGEIVPGGDETE